jgi:hypothetical protein
MYTNEIWGYNADPSVKIIPNILSQLSHLELLLNKRVACESSVDYTRSDSVDAMTASLNTLKDLSGRAEEELKLLLKRAFPNSSISYFLFQHNLANMFPRVATHFNSPVSYRD